MFFNQYPYININDLNLDYILRKLKEIEINLKDFIKINTIKYADPIQWNITTQYEANTVVIDANTGTAYLSVAPVPSGIALTNTDYWTVIFTLDILSANQNITFRNDGANVLATFDSAIDDWLIWNGNLYKVIRAIATNEAYVEGYNLQRYTVELFIKDYINAIETLIDDVADMVGDLDDLTTTDKSNVVNAINEVFANYNSLKIFVTPQMYGAVADGVADDTYYVELALASGLPVYIDRHIKYNRNNITEYPHNAVIYDESKGGYIRQIQNGDEGGAVNEWVFEAPYHPAIMLDVNENLNSDTPLPSQTDVVAAVGFRHNNEGMWAMRADFKFDTLRFEHFDGYKQTMILRPNNVIINNSDYSQAVVTPYTLHVNGTIGQVATNSTTYNVKLNDAQGNLLKLYQILFDSNGVSVYDSTSSPIKLLGKISPNGYASFNSVGATIHTTAEIRSFDLNQLALGAMCFDVTLNKLVILRSKSPLQWVDANGNVVIS